MAGGILVVFLVYSIRNSGLDAPVQRPAVQMLATQSKVATATERYWQDTVAPLYLARYDWPADAQQNALASMRRLLQQTQTTVAKARAVPIANVDPELVAMVGRHLSMEEATLKFNSVVLDITEELVKNSPQKAEFGQLSLETMVAKGLEYAQQPGVPPDVKEVMEMGAGIQENYDHMLHEIEIMQAKLQERYRSQKCRFPLPPIRDLPGRLR